MDLQTLDKVSQFLKDATPEQITQIAQDMAEKAPHLIQVPATNKEKVEGLIKIHLGQLADSPNEIAVEYYLGYVQGLIACAYVVGLLTDEENEHYHFEADKVASEAQQRLGASNE